MLLLFDWFWCQSVYVIWWWNQRAPFSRGAIICAAESHFPAVGENHPFTPAASETVKKDFKYEKRLRIVCVCLCVCVPLPQTMPVHWLKGTNITYSNVKGNAFSAQYETCRHIRALFFSHRAHTHIETSHMGHTLTQTRSRAIWAEIVIIFRSGVTQGESDTVLQTHTQWLDNRVIMKLASVLTVAESCLIPKLSGVFFPLRCG